MLPKVDGGGMKHSLASAPKRMPKLNVKVKNNIWFFELLTEDRFNGCQERSETTKRKASGFH